RAEQDDSYPLHWDFSAAGGIEDNETHSDAAARELMEELGVEAPLEFFTSLSFQGDDLYIYKGVYDSDFFKTGPEVEDVLFLNLDQIKQKHNSGEKFHPEFIHVLNKYFF
ncbi:MAG: isopentenyl-diphosphate delta-isomerase, partial [Oceanicoccus sp.]